MHLIDTASGRTYGVPGYGLQVLADGQIERQDLSGERSGAAGVHGGWKPWRITVATRIPRDDPWAMALLRELFDAADAAGEPALYEVAGSDTCEALGIRRVRFADAMRIEEGEEERTWRVTFTLEEVDAVPERREQREAPAQAGTGAPADLAQTVAEAMAAVEQGDTAAARSALERLLAFLDELAGRYLYGATG